MDPRMLRYYERELRHIRETGAEFAQEFPKIAGRLGLEGFECADPYVERLLEGFAFLAARVQLKLDAEFPRFTQHLLEMVYPDYLAPTPSMAVVQFQPDRNEGALADGFVIPRDSALRSLLGKGDQTPCEYRTAHELTLWPLELAAADYFPHTGPVANTGLPLLQRVKAGLRLRLRCTAGLSFDKLALDRLPVFLRGTDQLPMHLYEQLLAHALAVIVRPSERTGAWFEVLPKDSIRRRGFTEDEAVLPQSPRSFQGYRLLREYFAFPERFLFVEFGGLGPVARRCTESELEIIVLLDQSDPVLENTVDSSHFALYCTPAINLFPKRADRIHLSNQTNEFHIVPDRTRPLDFEVYAVSQVTGFGSSNEGEQPFQPFYAWNDLNLPGDRRGYYTLRREPRLLSSRQRLRGPRSSYIGSEVFISLVDANEAPYRSELRQLALSLRCTNRDLPLQMPLGKTNTDFSMESGAPVESIRCLAGPTKPKPSYAEGDATWRLISHLSLNYLTVTDTSPEQGAAALRELLRLYGDTSEAHIRKQIEGVKAVDALPVTRRMPIPGPITFGRGLEVSVTCDEAAFEGTGVFLLGAVLEQFFAKYVSINTFTETVIKTADRGEIMRWPTRAGRRGTL